MKRISIVGTVGVPGNYGGFETLAENLVNFHDAFDIDCQLTVYCSSKSFEKKLDKLKKAELRYLNLNANGIQSIIYDGLSIFDSLRRKTDVLLLLGVSGAFVLPLVRIFSSCVVVTNIDGIEWKRTKWGKPARFFLKWSEYLAVRWSHVVVADNFEIGVYVREAYGRSCDIIAYGGDHALAFQATELDFDLPKNYTLGLCRIEPENNVAMILEAFVLLPEFPLIFVGNWESSEYGRRLRSQFQNFTNLYLLDPIYDPGKLRALRQGAMVYVHGHSAGGTNPSLVEMMHFAIPIVSHGCSFNRHTTENKAIYFSNSDEIIDAMIELRDSHDVSIGSDMMDIAKRRYRWDVVGSEYFRLLTCSR